jgi:hypothetical protein
MKSKLGKPQPRLKDNYDGKSSVVWCVFNM